MKEYKEGKQKTATMVNKRRLSPPSIYEGPLSTSPLHSIARSSSSLPRLPSSDRLSESPLHVFDFSPFEPRRSSKRAPFLGRPLRPQDPLSSSREGNHGGGGEEEGPRFEQFLLALTLCPPKGGKKKKKKKEKKGKERKNWRKLRLLLLRKVIVPWWRPIRKCFAREEDWALAGCWLSHNRGKEESGEVEGGDGRRWLKGNKSTRESKWGTCRAFCGPDTTGYYPSFR